MKSIRKAVIPVAGLGTRFLPATKVVPKELLPIVDKPALQYVIEEALASGITEIILVTNPLKDLIQEHFSSTTLYDKILKERGKHGMLEDLYDLNEKINIITVYQDKPAGLGHAVMCAKEEIGADWFVVLLPDMLIDSDVPCTAQLVNVWRKTGKPVILADHAPKEMLSQYGIIGVDNSESLGIKGAHKVSALIEKPKIEDAPSDLFIAGRYLLPPTVFDYLSKVKPGSGGEIQLTDALIEVVNKDGMIALEMNGVLHDTGDKLGYLKANLYYGMKKEEFGQQLLDYVKTLQK